MGKGIGGHTRAYRGLKDEWLTPPFILESLGEFDLDPCAPVKRPWKTAKDHYTIDDDGLFLSWFGRVWLNPPYGPQTAEWLAKMCRHQNGIVLMFARTETAMFFKYVWNKAKALLFIEGRLYFYHADGTKARSNSGGPSVLIAWNNSNAECLRNCSIKGKFIELRK